MDVQVNWLGVLLAGVSSMIIGFIYYMPGVFGKEWMSLGKINAKLFQKQQPRLMPLIFVAALITAYVLAVFMFVVHQSFGYSWMVSGIDTAVWTWVGFSFTTLFIHNSLDQRPFRLTAISMGNRLLSLVAIGLVLGWLHP